MAYLKADEAPTKVFSKYADLANVFLPKLAAKFSIHTEINNHAIEFVDNQQPPYSFIHSLGSVELKMVKTYIKNNLANNFIRPFKFFIRASIFFNKKLDGSLKLYVDY